MAGPPPNADIAGEPRDAGLIGRETKGEVVLVPRLRAALEKLNATLPPEAIAVTIDELTRDRSAMLLEQANHEVYQLLKEGILVSVADMEDSTPGHTSSGLRPTPYMKITRLSNEASAALSLPGSSLHPQVAGKAC